jgi:tRNA-splicing ligase RtcB
MDRKYHIEAIDDVRWRIPIQGAMRVEGRVYADAAMMETLRNDPCLAQIANVASLPGIVGHALAMPDLHWGYGFPIGGVAAFDPDEGGVVSPGGVGYDINCGVRLHTTALEADAVAAARDKIADAIQHVVPAGTAPAKRNEPAQDLDAILGDGAHALVADGFARRDDLDAIEDTGRIETAEPTLVSRRARDRGVSQLGTLGGGNHFLEIDRIAEVYDPVLAERFGLRVGGTTLLVHSGSRGLGHAVCEELIPLMLRSSGKHGITLIDKQLACAPLGSDEANRYLQVMAAAANFAFANRALMAYRAIGAIAKSVGVNRTAVGASLLYDVCHNIAKFEEHLVEGRRRRVCVHRKGATRAFGPGHPLVPERYRDVGQPVIIPGDMGRYSYVMCGASGAMAETFGSACHGAGRLMARATAKKATTGAAVLKTLTAKGIALRASSVNGLVEEMPEAYKDVADVVGIVEHVGLARRVARLEPLIVVKG